MYSRNDLLLMLEALACCKTQERDFTKYWSPYYSIAEADSRLMQCNNNNSSRLSRSFLPLMMMILLQHFAIATSLHNLSILMSLATVNVILLLMNLDTTLLVVVLQANIM
jgi:hypothetical protein